MNHLRLPFLILLLIIGGISTVQAQGTIRGKVNNGTTGDILQGATVRLVDPNGQVRGGAYTDLEGTYTIKTSAGNYSLIISYISYISDTINDVTLEDGQVVFNETLLVEETAANEELAVDIVGKRSRASTVAFDQQKKKSVNAIDGVTFDLVKRTGDANVAAAMQRVVGVTVQDGKYVYVRGLGDRYSQTLLNGADLPSLDPNRNTVQMDIFPSNLIDQVVVYKNFTPDLPGSFTGGLIDVRTKDFPDRPTINISASLGYNTNASLRNDILSDEKSSTDWLGYDNGKRDVPEIIGEPGSFLTSTNSNTDFDNATIFDQAIKSFQVPLHPVEGSSFLNQNYQISLGNQYNLSKNIDLGLVGSLSYRNTFGATNEGGNAFYTISGPNDRSLGAENDLTLGTNVGSQSVLWGTMAKASLKLFKNHKVSLNYLHNNSGDSQSRILNGIKPANTTPSYRSISVNYYERALDVFQLNGESVFGPLTVDYIGSLTTSSQNQPDQRLAAYRTDGGEFQFDQSEQLIAQRFFRQLQDQSADAKLNLKYDFSLGGNTGFVKAGGSYTQRTRVFTQRVFNYESEELRQAVDRIDWDGDPEDLFIDENSGIIGRDSIPERIDGQFVLVEVPLYGIILNERLTEASESQFDGTQDVIATYLMAELPISSRLKFVGGARYEYSTQVLLVTERGNRAVDQVYNDILPSANFIYAATEDMNIRLGYSRTLARPAFRELAQIQYIDYLGDFTEEGNPNLVRSLIDNVDLRWEWFFGLNELISVSGFYKVFQDPIVRTIITRNQNPSFTYVNQETANVYGIEVEFRKNLAFINEGLENLSIGGNVSLIQSEVQLEQDELDARRANFPGLPDTRPLFSQSPYAVNAELLYTEPISGWTGSLSYNIFGPRLIAAGATNSLDAYEQPRGLLNFSLSKRIKERWSIRFRANNILNPEYFSTTTLTPEIMGLEEGAFETQSFPFRSQGRRGQTFSLSVSYSIK
ncbi:MAG: TonB-dependent receptor [Bacteroidota bacterium]